MIETSRLCSLLEAEKISQKSEGDVSRVQGRLINGADIIVQTGLDFLNVLFCRHMEGHNIIIRNMAITAKYRRSGTKIPCHVMTGCHPMTVLLILEYLYSDDIPALWDRRVGVPCSHLFKPLKLDHMQVKIELLAMARILKLSSLSEALLAPVKHVPIPTIPSDLHYLFHEIPTAMSATNPDVFLELVDKVVPCHSIVLRTRCSFFRSFFDDENWTSNRWSPDGTFGGHEASRTARSFICRHLAIRWERRGHAWRLDDVEF